MSVDFVESLAINLSIRTLQNQYSVAEVHYVTHVCYCMQKYETLTLMGISNKPLHK